MRSLSLPLICFHFKCYYYCLPLLQISSPGESSQSASSTSNGCSPARDEVTSNQLGKVPLLLVRRTNLPADHYCGVMREKCRCFKTQCNDRNSEHTQSLRSKCGCRNTGRKIQGKEEKRQQTPKQPTNQPSRTKARKRGTNLPPHMNRFPCHTRLALVSCFTLDSALPIEWFVSLCRRL